MDTFKFIFDLIFEVAALFMAITSGSEDNKGIVWALVLIAAIITHYAK